MEVLDSSSSDSLYDETYLIDAGVIIERYENSERKSILMNK